MREVVISAIYPLNMTLSVVILLMGEMQISCGHCQSVVIQCIALLGCPFLLIPQAVISILDFKLLRVEKEFPRLIGNSENMMNFNLSWVPFLEK